MKRPFFDSPERMDKLSAAARAWRGVPFREYGRSRKGLDCVGCALCIYREAGFECAIDIPRYTMELRGLRNDPELIQKLKGSPQFELLPDQAALQKGDLLWFRYGRQPWHVGILLTTPDFVHVYRDAGCVVESSLQDPTWKKRLTHVFRPIDFTTEDTEDEKGRNKRLGEAPIKAFVGLFAVRFGMVVDHTRNRCKAAHSVRSDVGRLSGLGPRVDRVFRPNSSEVISLETRKVFQMILTSVALRVLRGENQSVTSVVKKKGAL